MISSGPNVSGHLVRKLEAFGPLPEKDKGVLDGIGADARSVPSGTDLIREGDSPDGVFLILDGFACRYKLRANGMRQIMAYLVPGDFSDLDAALLSHMDDSIATLSACQVVRIAPETIQDLLRRPALARALRMVTLVDAATAREWLVNLGRRSAIERLAHLFCELSSRLAVVGLVERGGYRLPITQANLADTTGLSAVHVNRSLRDLRDAGLIELQRQHLAILDLPRLQELADFRPNYLHVGGLAAA